jgi:hypothetical protein
MRRPAPFNLKLRRLPVTIICSLPCRAKTKTDGLTVPMLDRETELTAILAVAQLAYDRVYCAEPAIAVAA